MPHDLQDYLAQNAFDPAYHLESIMESYELQIRWLIEPKLLKTAAIGQSENKDWAIYYYWMDSLQKLLKQQNEQTSAEQLMSLAKNARPTDEEWVLIDWINPQPLEKLFFSSMQEKGQDLRFVSLHELMGESNQVPQQEFEPKLWLSKDATSFESNLWHTALELAESSPDQQLVVLLPDLEARWQDYFLSALLNLQLSFENYHTILDFAGGMSLLSQKSIQVAQQIFGSHLKAQNLDYWRELAQSSFIAKDKTQIILEAVSRKQTLASENLEGEIALSFREVFGKDLQQKAASYTGFELLEWLLEFYNWSCEEEKLAEEFLELCWQAAFISSESPLSGAEDFLDCLKELLENAHYQPQTARHRIAEHGKKPALLVMGLHDALAMSGDSILICGMNAETWPYLGKASVWLPYQLQKDYEMPNSNLALEYQKSYEQLQILKQNYHKRYYAACQTLDGQEAKAHAYCADMPIFTPSWQGFEAPKLKNYSNSHRLKTRPSDEILRLSESVMTNFYNCPAKGQISLHLKAQAPLEEKPVGSDIHLYRSSLVHRLLEQFWHENPKLPLGTSSINPSSLVAKLREYSPSLKDYQSLPAWFDRELEIDLILRIAAEIIATELASEPRFQVEDTESTQQLHLEEELCHTRIRVDRLDILQDTGGLRLVDYKLKNKQPEASLSFTLSSLKKLQFPLYSYLQVVGREIEEMSFVICYLPAGSMPQVKIFSTTSETFQETREEWQQEVKKIIEEIRQGVADTSPLEERTCGHCQYGLICRYRRDLKGTSIDSEVAINNWATS